MKKIILYTICIIVITMLVQKLFTNYILDNVYIGSTVLMQEATYPEYANKYMGLGGYIYNKTILPIKIKRIQPIGNRGMEYYTTAITSWGFSEAQREHINKLENFENKTILQNKKYDVGIFYEFTGEYAVNTSAYILDFTIFGINFSKVCLVEGFEWYIIIEPKIKLGVIYNEGRS